MYWWFVPRGDLPRDEVRRRLLRAEPRAELRGDLCAPSFPASRSGFSVPLPVDLSVDRISLVVV